MIRSYLYAPDGTLESGLSSERLREALSQNLGLIWVDIEGPEDRDIELMLEVFEFHPLTVEDSILPNSRPKLDEFERYIFVVLQGIIRTDGRLRPIELNVCLGKGFLVTIRTERMKCMDEIATRVERKSPIITRGSDFFFYAVLEGVIDSYFPVVEEVEAQVDNLQTRMLSDATEATLQELLGIYKDLMLLRRTLSPHREVLTRLNRGDLAVISPSNALYFRDIYAHLLRMNDLVDSCREVATMSLEAYATIVSNRLNEIMKKMAAYATLALPLVIVTGVMGMNFGEHPELGPRWIYHILSVLLVGSVPLMLYLFRKYRWF